MRLGGRDIPAGALRFSFVASSGPGGQNVNKRRTRAELRVWVRDLGLAPDAAARLEDLSGPMGAGLVTEAGELIIECDEHRSQGRNKDEAVERLERLIRAAVVRPKVRRPTKPSKGAKRRRLDDKKQRGAIKKRRSGGGGDE
jgi:ribosome-associated protein